MTAKFLWYPLKYCACLSHLIVDLDLVMAVTLCFWNHRFRQEPSRIICILMSRFPLLLLPFVDNLTSLSYFIPILVVV